MKKLIGKKFKEEIIKDYAKILGINNFCDVVFQNNNLSEQETTLILYIKDFSKELQNTYKKILFRLGLMDLSLALLDKEITFPSKHLNVSNMEKAKLKTELNEKTKILKEIESSLKIKLKKLELNVFELNYLKIDKFKTF